MTRPLLSMPEAAKRLGSSRQHVYRLIEAGDLTGIPTGASNSKRPKIRIDADELDAFIAGRAAAAGKSPRQAS